MFTTPPTIMLPAGIEYPAPVAKAYKAQEAASADFTQALLAFYEAEGLLEAARAGDRAAMAAAAAAGSGPPKPANMPELEQAVAYQREVVVAASDKTLACVDQLKAALQDNIAATTEATVQAAQTALADFDSIAATAEMQVRNAAARVQDMAHALNVLRPHLQGVIAYTVNYAPPGVTVVRSGQLGNVNQVVKRLAELEAAPA